MTTFKGGLRLQTSRGLSEISAKAKIDRLKLPILNKFPMGFCLIYLYEQVEMVHQLLHELQALQFVPKILGLRLD
ncbi:hypothetical protein TH63_07190 [Rufibacter radiotolerans]|uniref:Uncharacterized protein n=1 Tax=Rufibacter radiotolerans TaxID=1379910 RepID=A0A0H4VI94_9BACT|nr:hypothetical protein [Rufibacter radiotolerans]AKQ45475.1 hypothetical protein TH63_07190 [Rufibacter radiotolerans]